MFRVFSVALAALVVVTATAHAQSSVAGAWELTINGPEGPITATADLKQDGEKVTGTINSQAGAAELTGTFKGKTLELAFQIQSPQGALDIKVNGEVTGADIKGMIDFGMGMADFTGKKK
jgi:hypothetical protein